MTATRNVLAATSLALLCLGLGGCPEEGDRADGASTEGAGTAGRSGAGAGAGAEQGAGTAPDAGSSCAMPSGSYVAQYVVRSGTCGPAPTHPVPFGNDITIQKFADVDVEAETIIHGCEVALVQIVRDSRGVPTERFQGPSLYIEDDGTITGVVTLTLYDADGQAVCSGDYDATFSLDARQLGGASGGTAGSGAAGSGAAGSGTAGGSAFSESYGAEIQKDCSETVNCFLQRDEQLEADPFQACIEDSSAALDADARLQAAFLANYARCQSYIVCDYYDCATSGASGYGATQTTRVQQRCQAESDCRAASGMPDPDPTYAVQSCVAIRTGELDVLSEAERMAWETAFQACSTSTGCALVDCLRENP